MCSSVENTVMKYLSELMILYHLQLDFFNHIIFHLYFLFFLQKAILLAQRLISMDACNAVFADLLFDDLIAVEQWLFNLASEFVGDEELRLKEALETCERTFGDVLRK